MPLKPGSVNLSKMRKRLPKEEQVTTPKMVRVPIDPTYPREGGNGNQAMHDEQQVARVELLMLKGVRTPHQLMTLLDISSPALMATYIRRVHARWEIGGSTREFTRHRGEALSKLDLLESEMWSKLSNLDEKTSPQITLNYLNSILNVQTRRNDILGLTAKVIQHIGLTTNDPELAKRASEHEVLTKVVSRLVARIEDRAKVIEHETPTR